MNANTLAWSVVAIVLFVWSRSVYAGTMPVPSPSSSPTAAGPCEEPTLASIVDRPGLGRPPATSGAVCVTPPGGVVLEFGYRNQTTAGAGRQQLAVYPEPVVLLGVAKRMEVIVAPGLSFSRRTGTNGDGFLPTVGQQDVAVGAQYLLSDRPAQQQALALLATFPTGYPTGNSGFSTGAPSYSLFYAVAFNFGGKFALSTSQGAIVASQRNANGVLTHFVAYQPTVNLSYAITTPTTLLLEDQLTAPTAPQGPTGNRALFALQQAVSPNILVDVEYELNLLPAPGFHQHALAAGASVRL